MVARMIVFMSMVCLTIYLIVWVSLKEILPLLNIQFTLFWYLFPIILTLSLSLIVYIGYKINEIVYSYSYILVFTIFGHLVNSFTCSLTLIIIKLFIKTIPKEFSIFLTIILPLIMSIYGLINARNIKIERITIHNPRFKGQKKTICHLSDMHLGAVYQREFVQKIVRKIKELKPDIVVITGDMGDGSLKVKSNWLTPFDTLSMPILYITGNHEQMNGKEAMLAAINETTIKYIGNDIYDFDNLTFVGVDYEYNLKKRLNEITPHNNEKLNILLCHVPELKPKDLKNFDIFLFLAGHTHGGQIFPFHPFVIIANACFNGLYEEDGCYVYVSPGVGSWGPPMRIGSHSTIGMITIEQ